MRSWRFVLFAASALAVHVAPVSTADDRSPKPYQQHSVLVVKRIPDATAAVEQFTRVSGIERVYVNGKARKIVFKLKASSTPSALQVWQLAEQLELDPVRLVTAQQVYTTKPEADSKSKPESRRNNQGSDR